MPTYIYQCNDCSKKKGKKKGKIKVDPDHDQAGWNDKGEYLFFVEASIKKIPKNPKCTCGGTDTIKLLNTNPYFYVRGNCYLDKKGVQKDQNMFKLKYEDPYGHMRTKEDYDYKMDQLRRSGLDMGKINRKHNELVKESLKAVSEMTMQDIAALTEDQKIILKYLYEHDDRANGVLFTEVSSLVKDANKTITDLINKFMVFKKNNSFILMAEGRSLADTMYG